MTSTQELRQAVKEINNPPPQPEDPGRSLDPASHEDPNLFLELIDGVFHQLSKDNALVAITADYIGLIPVRREAEPAATSQRGATGPCGQKRSAVRTALLFSPRGLAAPRWLVAAGSASSLKDLPGKTRLSYGNRKHARTDPFSKCWDSGLSYL